MSVDSARERTVVVKLTRVTLRLGIAALVLIAGIDSLQTAVAEGDTRTISFHHLHTNEDITVTYKRNGRYDEAALKRLDWFMRDWRKEESTHMDPHLFDLLWEVYREVGATKPIDVVCGYRSPQTNAMLRERSTGVAQFSQHTHGQAMDFYIPGVPLAEIRAVGLRLQRGGVGFYPTSGSPFVHLDTGSIRHWPRMTREQLVKVFPTGRTVHIPADGQPLRGYALALADVERHGSVPSEMSLVAARNAGVITASDVRVAGQPKRQPGLLASLFGSASQETDDESEQPAPKHSRAPAAVASLSQPVTIATETIVPLPSARPKTFAVAAAAVTPLPTRRPVVAVSLAGNMFDKRGYWNANATSGFAPAPARPIEVADADPSATGSTALSAFAYDAGNGSYPATRAHPMGTSLPHMPHESLMPQPADANTTVIVKQALTPGHAMHVASGGMAFDQPWLRATILTPSTSYMHTTRLGAADMKAMAFYMSKPDSALAMTFSADPQPGLFADRFSGQAVVFLATTSFNNRTASLR